MKMKGHARKERKNLTHLNTHMYLLIPFKCDGCNFRDNKTPFTGKKL
jgi:hypothetical protein